MDQQIDSPDFDRWAAWTPPNKYRLALERIGYELDELPPVPEVKPKLVEDLKKVKKDDLVKAYQSLYAAYTMLTEYTGVIRPTLEVVRDTAEESLLQ